MKYLKLTILLFATAILFANCEKNKNELSIKFKFVLLDTIGNEKTVFNQGENIIFSFQIINNSSEDLMVENFFPNDEFFKVYQSDTNEGLIDYGIPYGAIISIGYFSVLQADTLKIEYPWKGGVFWNEKYPILANENSNSDLPVGNFYTDFSQSFNISEIQTEEKHFNINFTVKE